MDHFGVWAFKFLWQVKYCRLQKIIRNSRLFFFRILNSVVVWMSPTRSPISNFSSPLIKTLGIIIGTTLTYMFHSFLFYVSDKVKFLSLFSFSLIFTRWSTGTAKSTIRQVLFFFFFFFFILVWFGRLPRNWWSVCISKSLKISFYAQFPVNYLRLYLHLIYTSYYVGSYLYFLWHSWSLWRGFVSLLEGTQLLS